MKEDYCGQHVKGGILSGLMVLSLKNLYPRLSNIICDNFFGSLMVLAFRNLG